MPIDADTAAVVSGITANLYKITAARSLGAEQELAAAPDSRLAFTLPVTAGMVRSARTAVDAGALLASQPFNVVQFFSPLF